MTDLSKLHERAMDAVEEKVVPVPTIPEQVQADADAGRVDVLTLAELARDKKITFNVNPAGNGWIVTLTIPSQQYITSVVFSRPGEIGQLFHRLFSSDLTITRNITKIRKLLGYM